MELENWVLLNKLGDYQAIMKEFSVCEQTARILVNRGQKTTEEIREYLYPELTSLENASHLPDLETLIAYLRKAIEEKLRIRVFGDYDVDGVCATFLCIKGLSELGARVDYCIPDRMKDGYGISKQMVENALRDGVSCILTVDNGIACVESLNLARDYGMTVLITDHHEPQEELPRAHAICDPKRKDSIYENEICGAVVAGKVMEVLQTAYGLRNFFSRHVEILALATVCDVMSLSGENRCIAKLGLEAMKQTKNLGLSKLIDVCGIGREELKTYHLGFVLGPCVNAIGRLETADAGVSLLLSEDASKAEELAEKLYQTNNLRKDKTQESVQKALEQLSKSEDKPNCIVLFLEECHESLAGIVAGRIREAFYRPAIVLTRSEQEGLLKGSARSIEGISIFELLVKCKDYLEKFGGHEQAAGLTLKEENLNAFIQKLAKEAEFDESIFVRKRVIDIAMPFSLISAQMLDEEPILGPFGKGNPQPLYAKKNSQILRLSYFGRKTKYLKLELREQERVYQAVYFGDADRFVSDLKQRFGEETLQNTWNGRGTGYADFLYQAEWNCYRDQKNLQIRISGYRFC